jgi:hypothetical protein
MTEKTVLLLLKACFWSDGPVLKFDESDRRQGYLLYETVTLEYRISS